MLKPGTRVSLQRKKLQIKKVLKRYRGYTICPTAEEPYINENDNGKLGFNPKIKALHKTS